MYDSGQELLIASLFIGFFNLMTVSALTFYYQKLEHSYLKFGIAALVCELLYQMSIVGLVAFEVELSVVLSVIARLLFSIFLFASLCHLTEKKVSLWAIGLTLGVTTGLGLGVLVLRPGLVLELLVPQLPGLVLVTAGAVMLMRFRLTPGYLALSSLIVIHLLLNCALVMIPGAESGTTLINVFDSVSILLMGSVLILICSERMMVDLNARDEKLVLFEQENRRLELQFSQAQKLESLGMLAGGIAHDFNNMLTSMIGYTSVAIKKLPSDSDIRKDLYMVMSGGRQAVDLTSQLLVYAGKGAAEFETLDISRIVDNMASVINSVVPRKIHLEHQVSRDLPMIRGDAVQLGQVLLNLVGNAVEAIESPTGDVKISTGVTEVNESTLNKSLFADDHEPGVYVFLRVTDSGVGMDFAQIEKIFDPFYSGKHERKGLGLASISGIVRQHRGFVGVDSVPGQGSVFTVYLPVVAYRDAAQLRRKNNPEGSAQVRGRILLADDDPRIRSLIATILEGDTFEVVSVVDGREAFDEITSDGLSFTAFVLDCTMPKIAGQELYREIRSSGLQTPVILISGYHEEQVVNDIERDEDAYFLKKPFSVDQLLEVVSTSVIKQSVMINGQTRTSPERG